MPEVLPTEELWVRYQETEAADLRDELVGRYLHLAKAAAARLAAILPSHVDFRELYTSGLLGLARAVERFDPSRVAKFESYAYLVIRGAILDELRAMDWVPRSVHQKAHSVGEARHELAQTLGREPTHEELATHLEIDLPALHQLLQQVQPAIMIPLEEADQSATEEDFTAEERERHELLQRVMRKLGPQERRVLRLYYYSGMKFKEIGAKLSLCESRISQIHSRALSTLRDHLEDLES